MKGAALILAFVGGLATMSTYALAQSAARFEVASVKPSATTATTGPESASAFRVSPSGLVTITNYSVRRLITLAYDIEPAFERHSPQGGATAVMSRRFDIAAKIPVDATPLTPSAPAETALRDTAQLMLRSLLSDRFGLRVRAEPRKVPVYALVVARQGTLGPDLRPSVHDCEVIRAARRKGEIRETPLDAKNRRLCDPPDVIRDPTTPNAQGLGQFVAQRMREAGPLSRMALNIQGFADRPIVDATGLAGSFEWQLEVGMPGQSNLYPALSTSLQEQLGLRLEARTALIEVIVIDAVALPTAD